MERKGNPLQSKTPSTNDMSSATLFRPGRRSRGTRWRVTGEHERAAHDQLAAPRHLRAKTETATIEPCNRSRDSWRLRDRLHECAVSPAKTDL